MTFSNEDRRLDNGVRRRMDGEGEPWSEAHRKLPRDFHMQDIDAMYGMVQIAKNASDQLFAEYVTDSGDTIDDVTREFGLVALFDIKSTRQALDNAQRSLSTKWYAWLARVVAAHQEVAPKFFFVLDQEDSYHYVESDIQTGEIVREHTAPKDTRLAWLTCWKELGLVKIRNDLKESIRRRMP